MAEDLEGVVLDLISFTSVAFGFGWSRACCSCRLLPLFSAVSTILDRRFVRSNNEILWP